MTNLQLGMRFVDKIQAISAVQKVVNSKSDQWKMKFCKDNGARPNAYVLDIYSRKIYRRTYQSNFYPVGHKDFWRDAPYNLTFYPLSVNNQRGRKHDTRFRGKWIIENRILPQDVADAECLGIIEKIVISLIQAMYKFLFFKVIMFRISINDISFLNFF
ncbi:hypothetical protein M9H77_14341 [Catharanthus roseus]|uniref:Uncharacterized protein n=1 Tax=Catharanthus roseus TaxID=4058 RepID=A0ACC0BN15_CATRO|nr:hypothetical protein M9H77_14341 [Catharanthus roseus]